MLDNSYFVRHIAMFVLRLALESVRSIHIFRLMVPPVDVHAIRVQPYESQDGREISIYAHKYHIF